MITKKGSQAFNLLALYGDDVALAAYRAHRMSTENEKVKRKVRKQKKTASVSGTGPDWNRIRRKVLKRALQIGSLSVPATLLARQFAPAVISRKDLYLLPLTFAAGGGVSGAVMSYSQSKPASVSGPGLGKVANELLLYSALKGLPDADKNPYAGDVVYARQLLANQAIKDGVLNKKKPSLLAHLAGGAAIGSVASPVASEILAHRLPPQFASKITAHNKGPYGVGIGALLGAYAGYRSKTKKDAVKNQARDYLDYYAAASPNIRQGLTTLSKQVGSDYVPNRKTAMPITTQVKTAASSTDLLAKQLKKSLNASGKSLTDKEKAFRAARESKLAPGLSGRNKALLGLGAAAAVGAGAYAKKKYDERTKTASPLDNLLGLIQRSPAAKKMVKANTRDWRVPGVPTGSSDGSALDLAVGAVEPRLAKIG